MFNPQLLTNGASYDEIRAETNRTRRAQALRNRVDGLRSQRSELETVLGNLKRRIAMGDNSAAMQVASIEKRIQGFTVEIDAGLERLRCDFGPKPAADEPKGAKRGKA